MNDYAHMTLKRHVTTLTLKRQSSDGSGSSKRANKRKLP